MENNNNDDAEFDMVDPVIADIEERAEEMGNQQRRRFGQAFPNNVDNRAGARPRNANNDLVLIPVDETLQRQRLITDLQRVSMPDLENENRRHTNMKYLDAILMRIICSAPTNNNQYGSLRMYGHGNKKSQSSSTANYSRLFLCKVLTSEANGNDRLFYLMESKTTNKDLWARNYRYRDDGTITIGTVFRVLAPQPIKNTMSGDLPLVETHFPVVVMKFPRNIAEVNVFESIQGNHSKAFVVNEAQLTVCSTTPKETTCSGMFCDKQRIHETNGKCGCYSMLSRRSNIAFVHWIESSIQGIQLRMETFSSESFSSLYLNGRMPNSVRISALQMTDAFFEISSAVENVANYVNDNGGWTIIGWYKRGVINDKTLTNNEGQDTRNNNVQTNEVDNGELTFHIVHIRPTNHRFMEAESLLQNELFSRRFDTSTLSSE